MSRPRTVKQLRTLKQAVADMHMGVPANALVITAPTISVWLEGKGYISVPVHEFHLMPSHQLDIRVKFLDIVKTLEA